MNKPVIRDHRATLSDLPCAVVAGKGASLTEFVALGDSVAPKVNRVSSLLPVVSHSQSGVSNHK
jgi:hypothetical protein